MVGIFIQHLNFSEVLVSLKHPKKFRIQEKHHGISRRAFNLVTSSEMRSSAGLVAGSLGTLRKSFNLSKPWFPHQRVGTMMPAYFRNFVRLK